MGQPSSQLAEHEVNISLWHMLPWNSHGVLSGCPVSHSFYKHLLLLAVGVSTPCTFFLGVSNGSGCCHTHDFLQIKRVRRRVVVVVVRELLFLVTSVVCVWIRGRGSEVTTTPYHIHSDFHEKQHSYHNGFVVLFLHYLSCKHKTYRYSV